MDDNEEFWNIIIKEHGPTIPKLVLIALSKKGFGNPEEYSKISLDNINDQIVPFIREDLHQYIKSENDGQLNILYGGYATEPNNYTIPEGIIDFIIGTSQWVAENLEKIKNNLKQNRAFKRASSTILTVDDSGILEEQVNEPHLCKKRRTESTLINDMENSEMKVPQTSSEPQNEKEIYIISGKAGIPIYIFSNLK